jgi:phosphoribosylamine--glycine ligase
LVDGGRVLSIVGSGDSLAQARERAYAAADTVRWPGMQHRTDIGL